MPDQLHASRFGSTVPLAPIVAMRFDDARDGYLYVVQQKTAKASDATWIRFAVTPQLQAVLS